MRLKQGTLITIQIAPQIDVIGAYGSVTKGWGEKTNIKAHIQPINSALIQAEYGQRTAYMEMLITKDSIHPSDGVWLRATDPPYIVVEVKEWRTHKEAVIERREADG